MLTYELKKSPGVPLYEALYRCIRDDILSGKLPSGEKLPSKRMMMSAGVKFTQLRTQLKEITLDFTPEEEKNK